MNARHGALLLALGATLAATWWAAELDDDSSGADVTARGADDASPRPQAMVPASAPREEVVDGLPVPASLPARVREPWPAYSPAIAQIVSFRPAPAASAPTAPPPPSAPPLPFRYVGSMADEKGSAVFLLDGSQVRLVRPGEQLDGRYRLEQIYPTSIEFTFLPLNTKQTLSRQSP